MACYICASLYLRARFSWNKTDNIYRPRCMLLIAYWDGFQNALGVSSTELCNYFPIVSLGATISSTVWVTTASAPSSASVSPLLLFPLTPRVCVCVSPTSDRFPTCRSGRESSHQPLCSGHLPPQLTHITSLHSPYDYTRLAVSLLDEELCVEDLTLSLFFVREDNTQAKKKKKKRHTGFIKWRRPMVCAAFASFLCYSDSTCPSVWLELMPRRQPLIPVIVCISPFLISPPQQTNIFYNTVSASSACTWVPILVISNGLCMCCCDAENLTFVYFAWQRTSSLARGVLRSFLWI